MKRGRPKGRPSKKDLLKNGNGTRSYGPVGDLVRSHRLKKGLGLLDVANACECSVQFVSNIEHGRAPLPWEKVPLMAQVLKIPVEELQAANLAIRSDFKSFVVNGNGSASEKRSSKEAATASAAALAARAAARDAQLREVIQRYQMASVASRRKFVRAALELLTSS